MDRIGRRRRGGFTMTRMILRSRMAMRAILMMMRIIRGMACQMPVGTGLKMGWGCYTGDRGILARYTIRVINCCHTRGEKHVKFSAHKAECKQEEI